MPKTLTCTSALSGKLLYVFVQQPDGFDVYAEDAQTADNRAEGLLQNTFTMDELQDRLSTGYVEVNAENLNNAELAERVDGMVKGTPKK